MFLRDLQQSIKNNQQRGHYTQAAEMLQSLMGLLEVRYEVVLDKEDALLAVCDEEEAVLWQSLFVNIHHDNIDGLLYELKTYEQDAAPELIAGLIYAIACNLHSLWFWCVDMQKELVYVE